MSQAVQGSNAQCLLRRRACQQPGELPQFRLQAMTSGDDINGTSASFDTTQWSVVLEARHSDPARALAALERLCVRYWFPLYAFVRRRGHEPADAEDLTQSFFEHLLDKEGLSRVDRGKGLFRTFLLTALTNFINDTRDRQRAAKRGGRHRHVPLDALSAEEVYHQIPHDLTPELLFERRWAYELVEQVLERLRKEHEGQRELFARLEPCLTGEVTPRFYAETASALGTTEGAVRVALHRLRRRLGEMLRREVAHTVSHPDEVEGEIRHLLTVIGTST